jgi:hypothetical protein
VKVGRFIDEPAWALDFLDLGSGMGSFGNSRPAGFEASNSSMARGFAHHPGNYF